ncbi:MAG: flagellar FliJ family protein [Synergistaceae bacterium]|jgi:flagellar export protein FliJ|nr:flagellar FliJ family protein [Synergistaceae bacterium]
MSGELKRFKRVLHIREEERELTQWELSVRMREEESILTKMSEIEAKRDDAMADFCAEKGVVSPQQLWFERQNLDVMEKKLNLNKQELECCRVQIEETKTELIEKHRSVQLMERYVDKLKDREDKKVLNAEQNNLDDINTMRFHRDFTGEADL